VITLQMESLQTPKLTSCTSLTILVLGVDPGYPQGAPLQVNCVGVQDVRKSKPLQTPNSQPQTPNSQLPTELFFRSNSRKIFWLVTWNPLNITANAGALSEI
jgi:hypothetical protein